MNNFFAPEREFFARKYGIEIIFVVIELLYNMGCKYILIEEIVNEK